MITVNGNSLDWEEGMNIHDVLRKMNYSFPLIVVKVNDQLVKPDRWSDFFVPDRAVVYVIHLTSGG